MKNNLWRGLIEVGFIIFLFYSNLLMGEFERTGMGSKRGLSGLCTTSLQPPILELPWSPLWWAISHLKLCERSSSDEASDSSRGPLTA